MDAVAVGSKDITYPKRRDSHFDSRAVQWQTAAHTVTLAVGSKGSKYPKRKGSQFVSGAIQ
jgi:hypothetical protein